MGISQEALGEKLNVSRQAVSKWEADGAVPEVDKLIALGRLFGVSLNELLQVEGRAELDAAGGEPEAGQEYIRCAHRQRRWRYVACGLAIVLGIAVFSAVLSRQAAQISRLERRIEELHQTDPTGLDSTAPLVADFNFSFDNGYLSSEGTSFTLYLNVIPVQSTADMTVTFQISQPGYKTQLLSGERAEGGTAFSVSHFYQKRHPGGMTISAVFDDGIRQYTQALVRVVSWSPGSGTWDILWGNE